MRHKLSISKCICNGSKIVIAFLIFLLCIDKSSIVLCSDSSAELVVIPEDTLPISNFVEKCEQRCLNDQNRTQYDLNDDKNDGDTLCKSECTIKQCGIGCSLWENALDSSCQEVCNKSNFNDFDNRQIFCIKGCNDASNFYFKWIRQEVSSPTAFLPPALIPDSLTSTSLSLEWTVPTKFSELAKGNLFKKTKNETYFVQCYEDYEDDFWKYCGNQTKYENSTIYMEKLHPYTKYKFRVALLLSENEAIYSEPSVVISTLEEGIPESEPKIIQASSVDQTRIMVQWKPGLRNNGQVLSYYLTIDDISSARNAPPIYKEVPASNQTNYYIFEKLSPGRNYSIKISTRNARGVGPAAEVKACTIDYLTKDNSNEEEPKLIIATEYKVVSRVKDFFGGQSPTTIYTSNSSKIAGIAIEIEQQLLFVAEENGCIYQSSLTLTKLDKNKKEIICQKSGLNSKPSLLSIDWLNKHLYILGEMPSNSDQLTSTWSILRCDYEGKNLIVAYGGLNDKPLHFEVDPYNGYLFWVISGDSNIADGLWKLDLGDISNGIKHEVKPSHMIKGNRLGAFIVDHARFQLSIPFQNENTIKTMTLKGDLEDIRHNTQSPILHSVKSLVKIKGLFFWTDGTEYRVEEYHREKNVYFHNSFADSTKTKVIAIRLNSSLSQPAPVPVNPPLNCQALLSATKAKVSWKTPELIHEQGKGAFRKWKYILEINGDFDRNFTDITGNTVAVDGLTPNTLYSFKVAGYLAEKNCGGSWSQNFKGKTLKTDDERQLIWASKEGVVKSDVIGENITILYEKGYLGDVEITDITWFEDLIYIVANETLKIFNTTSNEMSTLRDVEGVSSVAIDWISRRLFWSVPSQQLIMNSRLNGDMRKPLAIPAKAQEIKIDALHGNIYYSTGTKIESRRLNGKNNGVMRKYFQVLPYSGKLVMGLTLDIENENVYWIVKSQSGSSLFSAKLMDLWDETMEPNEEKLSERNILGPLAHFSDRLVWRKNDAGIVIADMNGTNLAMYEDEKINGLTTVAVIDKSYYKYPFEGKVSVIPEPVIDTSVSIIGTYKIFNISWEPVKNINHGEVFYEITIKSRKLQHDIVAEQTSNIFTFPLHTLVPHTPLDIMIISYTSWGASDPIKASIYSPTGFPSVPRNPRVYTKHLYRPLKDNVEISASFRWSVPEHPNGLIMGYKVRCIDKATNKVIHNKTVYSTEHEYTVNNLKKDADYLFDVQAYTEVGDGNVTDGVHVRTSHERPIPKILISTDAEIVEVDLDTQKSARFASINRPVTAFAYIAHEQTLYFMNVNNELMMSKIDGNREPQKLTSMSSAVQALAIDWIERVLYWSQVEDDIGIIYSYNLNNGNVRKVIEREDVISDLVITPFDRRLFWIENHEELQQESGIHYLDLETNEIKMLFERNEQCLNMTISEMSPNPRSLLLATSPINPTFENDVVDDLTYEPLLIFEMGHELHRKFTAVDLATKKCLDFGEIYKSEGTNLAKDSNKVYWINGENIYGREDLTHNPISYPVSNLHQPGRLLAFYQQYFPKKHCLLPIEKNYRIKKIESSDKTLTFDLPKPELPPDCTLKNIPIKYSIRYIKTERLGNANMNELCEESPGKCKVIKTFDRTEKIKNLKPFTHYSIQIALSSIYDKTENLKYGEYSDFITDHGTPSLPRNVSAIPLSYNEIFVSWLKPEIPNAPRVYYLIAWETQNHEDHSSILNKQQKYLNLGENSTNEEKVSTIIKVNAGQNYKISVRACSKNDTCSEGVSANVNSYVAPKNIILNNTTPTSMILQWERPEHIKSFAIQYTKQDEYRNILTKNSSIEPEKPSFYLIDGLEPKTKYNFSILLKYSNSDRVYRWTPPHKIEFETLGDRPSAPKKPTIRKSHNTIYVEWNKPRENGADIEEYLLESKRISSLEQSSVKESRHKRSVEESNDINHDHNNEIEGDVTDIPTDVEDKPKEEWKKIYNGTHAQYIYSGNDIVHHIFRVKARNEYGWGEFSESSDRVNNMTLEMSSSIDKAEINRLWMIMLILVGMILIFMCLICSIWMVYRNRRNKKFADDGVPIPDFELHTLRDLPDNLLVNSRNILYNHFYGPFLNPEIKHLPQIYQHQIIITDKCLGKGAFGEVWSGIVKHDDGSEELVAIKTLHKGANDLEKREFLQEAQLMSNFKHDHILRLIGVCLNQNECLLYIVMELMESGDLLSFLRNNRPTINKPSSLKLVDLISVCVDVAAGCRYLEEMHFVHRDIAARNCLVKTTPRLTVKLGDFGLARDIYKNDYYRKEGEGLLPVRWMSPESLVDGVFTSQSDIWAFGVLMWEVMTLGQQPYPARTNIEVLHYVRDGGRLARPNCPDEIFQLMTKCWNRIDHRPTFRHCLDVLTQLHDHFLYHYADVELPIINDTSCKYVSSDDSSIMNEKVNAASETSSENFQLPSIPKYLELAYDANDERNVDNNMCEAPPINYIDDNHDNHIKDDGYEIPINFDTELDINANNELNSNLSKSRTLSNSSTISNKSDHQNYDHHLTHPILSSPQHQIPIENCKRSSLILERENKIYPQLSERKILASGWV